MATRKKTASTDKRTKTTARSKASKARKTAGAGKAKKSAKPAVTGGKTKDSKRKPAKPKAAAKALRAPRAAKPAKVAAKKLKMPAKKRREFRSMLVGLKARLVEQIATLQNDSLTRHEPINPEEDGTVAFDRQFALNLVSTERESLFEVDDALRRIDSHAYGICEECGELIGESRLMALPFVRMCVGCQSAKEKGKARFTPMFG